MVFNETDSPFFNLRIVDELILSSFRKVYVVAFFLIIIFHNLSYEIILNTLFHYDQ